MSDENQNPEQSIQDNAGQTPKAVNDADNQTQGTTQGHQVQGDEMLGGLFQKAEDKVDQTIDQLGERVPGGSKFTEQAKKSAGSIIENLRQQAEKRLSGLFGGHKDS